MIINNRIQPELKVTTFANKSNPASFTLTLNTTAWYGIYTTVDYLKAHIVLDFFDQDRTTNILQYEFVPKIILQSSSDNTAYQIISFKDSYKYIDNSNNIVGDDYEVTLKVSNISVLTTPSTYEDRHKNTCSIYIEVLSIHNLTNNSDVDLSNANIKISGSIIHTR